MVMSDGGVNFGASIQSTLYRCHSRHRFFLGNSPPASAEILFRFINYTIDL